MGSVNFWSFAFLFFIILWLVKLKVCVICNSERYSSLRYRIHKGVAVPCEGTLRTELLTLISVTFTRRRNSKMHSNPLSLSLTHKHTHAYTERKQAPTGIHTCKKFHVRYQLFGRVTRLQRLLNQSRTLYPYSDFSICITFIYPLSHTPILKKCRGC